jgi:hypothetical protein
MRFLLSSLLLVCGTAVATAQDCDPNNAGACVPKVWPADVDCLGGKGDGPYYTDGTQNFRVVGTDRYGLDTNDQDTIACEPPRR